MDGRAALTDYSIDSEFSIALESVELDRLLHAPASLEVARQLRELENRTTSKVDRWNLMRTGFVLTAPEMIEHVGISVDLFAAASEEAGDKVSFVIPQGITTDRRVSEHANVERDIPDPCVPSLDDDIKAVYDADWVFEYGGDLNMDGDTAPDKFYDGADFSFHGHDFVQAKDEHYQPQTEAAPQPPPPTSGVTSVAVGHGSGVTIEAVWGMVCDEAAGSNVGIEEYGDDNFIYDYADCSFLGNDQVQVKGGTFLDNCIDSDNVAEAEDCRRNGRSMTAPHMQLTGQRRVLKAVAQLARLGMSDG